MISGLSLLKDDFKLLSTEEYININFVKSIINGNSAVYKVSNFFKIDYCEVIKNNFLSSQHKVVRYGVGKDDIEAYILGSSHIEKYTSKYLNNSQETRQYVDELFNNIENPIQNFINKLIENNLKVRPAGHEGKYANLCKGVLWNNIGDFLLLPHEDLSQLKDPRQNDFEINTIENVMAVNFYPAIEKGAGKLKIWNIIPDQNTKENLGLQYSGYPYPIDSIQYFDSMVLEINPGDLILLNGNLVHAVLGGEDFKPKSRILITCFMGERNGELLYWT